MRVVIAGGGTGGHLYPGLALAEELKKRSRDTEIVFMGTENGIESRVIPNEGYHIKLIPSEGFVGVSLLRKTRSSVKLVKALKESYNYLKDISPDVVVGSGGYASFAPLIGAWLLSIPVMILEQNNIPGRANRLLAHIARAVCITYQESMAYFPREKVHLTGNPVRKGLLNCNGSGCMELFSLEEGVFTVFIFGGSAGAASINRTVVDALQYLLDIKDEVQFLHQTGVKDFKFVRDAYRSYGYRGTVTPFIYQMPEAYAVADVVVSRAGATTLSEICVSGKPSILIPYPYATDNHQEMNARRLESAGAAVVITDRELSGERLAEEIRRLYREEGLREGMKKKALALGRPDAVKRIADIALSLIH
jgi:UDP-N-acetylglucosamine--N-acetylmuramyl-(pentapeptide) pyrophosphoryl-undecaprenol N-acetylglucosamine transferase